MLASARSRSWTRTGSCGRDRGGAPGVGRALVVLVADGRAARAAAYYNYRSYDLLESVFADEAERLLFTGRASRRCSSCPV